MSDNKLKCEDCGTEENVTETTCPYAADVNAEIIEVVLCDDCYHERCMDI